MRIGVIGAGGRIGRDVCFSLSRIFSESIIVLGGRNFEHVKELELEIPKSEFKFIDYRECDSLRMFMQHVDLVCICSGNANDSSNIIECAILMNKDVISLSDLNIFTNIYNKYHNNTSSRIILGNGIVPGLSGLLPRYLKKFLGDKIDKLEVYYWGQEIFSFSSAKEYIESIIYDSNIENKNNKQIKIHRIKNFSEELISVPVESKEFELVSNLINVDIAYFNSFINNNLFKELCSIREKILQNYDMDHMAIALCNASKKDVQNTGSFHRFNCVGYDKYNNICAEMIVLSRNGNAIIAKSIITSIQTIIHSNLQPGIYPFACLVDPVSFINTQMNSDTFDSIEFIEKKDNMEYDIGEL